MIKNWGTYDGRTVQMSEISHQHLSNIYHYISVVVPELYESEIRKDIEYWINTRFGGIILGYHPDPEFTQEKNYLRRNGFLNENDFIVVENKIIGCY